jgi:HlyD family secretion protein
MKKVLWSLLAVVVVAASGFGVWRLYARSAHPRVKFRTAVAQQGDLKATINATGTIEPEEVIDVGAQVAGLIKEFGKDPRDSTKSIDYGSPVDKGTVLAKIDDSLYAAAVEHSRAVLGQAEANVQQAEANLASARSKLIQTQRDWKRVQELLPSKAVAPVDYDTAQNAYETAQAAVPGAEAALNVTKKTVDTAKADLKQAEINLGYCTIQSPVKGIIIDRRVNVGQTVVSSLSAPSLFLLAKDLKRMQVWASVNEADIGRIKIGQTVTFTVDAFPGEKFTGEVSQIRLNATMTQNVVTYTVVVTTDNSNGKLLPYLTANLEFEVSHDSNVLLVPNAALRWQPSPEEVTPEARDDFRKMLRRQNATTGEQPAAGAPAEKKETHEGRQVWVEDNGFVKPVKVRPGLSDGAMTEILAGDLKEGTAVVVGEEHSTDAGSSDTSNPFTPHLFGGKKQ